MTLRKNNKARGAGLLTLGLALLTFLVVVLALSPGSTLRAAPEIVGVPSWGSDAAVNPPPQQTPAGMRNAVMAVNPANPNQIVAAYEDSSSEFKETAYAWSSDAGQTWSTSVLTSNWGLADFTPFGDVNVAYDGHGTAYLATLAIYGTDSILGVVTSTNGTDWSTPVVAAGSVYTDYRSLTSMAVDKRLSGPDAGGAYLFYLYTNVAEEPYQRGIWMRYSHDGAATWNSADIQVSDTDHYTSSLVTSDVASDGTVYAVWEFMPSIIPTDTHTIYLDRSTDGGRTWGDDRMVGGGPIEWVGGTDWKNRELTLLANPDCNSVVLMRLHHRPVMSVSPQDPNTVYVAWMDSRWDTEEIQCSKPFRHGDIAFSRTTDGGLTWSEPARVNDDTLGNGVDQFLPTMAVAADGTVGITWYDRRYDPTHFQYDLAYSQSTDGGLTWSANQRITDVSSDATRVQDLKLIGEVGFRKSLVYGPDYSVATWLDTRLGINQGDLFADRGTFPAILTATPSDTSTSTSQPTETSSPTGTASATLTTQPSVTATACPIQFTDVEEGSTFYTFVRCLACQGIINGYTTGCETGDPCFRPGNPVTRGPLSKIVANAAGLSDPPGVQLFEDVLPGSTFYDFIQRLALLNYVSGYPCGGPGEPCGTGNLPYFRPNNNVTRGQISKIVANAAGLSGPPGAQLFEDVVDGSTFYVFIQQLAQLGVMNGYPCGGPGEPCGTGNLPYFRPSAGATRGQVSKIVANTFFPGCDPAVR